MVRLLGKRGRTNRVAQRYLAAIEGDQIEVTPESPAHSKSTRRTARTDCSDSWTPTVRQRRADDSSLTTGSDAAERRKHGGMESDELSNSIATTEDVTPSRDQPGKSLNAAMEKGLDMLLYSNAFSCNGAPPNTNRTRRSYKKMPRKTQLGSNQHTQKNLFPSPVKRAPANRAPKSANPDRSFSPTRSDFTGAETEIATNRAVDLAMRRIQTMESGVQAARRQLAQNQQQRKKQHEQQSLISDGSSSKISSSSPSKASPLIHLRPPPNHQQPTATSVCSQDSDQNSGAVHQPKRHPVVVHPDASTIDSMSVDIGQGQPEDQSQIASEESSSHLMIPHLSKDSTLHPPISRRTFQQTVVPMRSEEEKSSSCLSPPDIERKLPNAQQNQASPDPIFCSKSPSFMSGTSEQGSIQSNGATFMEKPTPNRLVTKRWPPVKSSLLSGRKPSAVTQRPRSRPHVIEEAPPSRMILDLPMDARPVPEDPYDQRPPPQTENTNRTEIFRRQAPNSDSLEQKLERAVSDVWDDIDQKSAMDVRSLRSVFESIEASPTEPEGKQEEDEDDDTASVKSLRERFEPSIQKSEPSEEGSKMKNLRSLFENSPVSPPLPDDDDTASVKSLREKFEAPVRKETTESEVTRMKRLFESKMLPEAKRYEGTSKMRETFELYEPCGLRQSRDRRGVGRRLVSHSPLGNRVKSWLKQKEGNGDDVTAEQVSSDSRSISPNDLGAVPVSSTSNNRVPSDEASIDDAEARMIISRYQRPNSMLEPGATSNDQEDSVSQKLLRRGFQGLQNGPIQADSRTELLRIDGRDGHYRFDRVRPTREKSVTRSGLAPSAETGTHQTPSSVLGPKKTEVVTNSQTSSATWLLRRAELLSRSRLGRKDVEESGSPPVEREARPLFDPQEKSLEKEFAMDVDEKSPSDQHRKLRLSSCDVENSSARSLNGHESSGMVRTGSSCSMSTGSLSGSDYSDGVTLDASIANVSALTNPTALLGVPTPKLRRGGKRNATVQRFLSSDGSPDSARGIETKKSEASSTQPSESRLPLIGSLLRMSDDVSEDSFDRMPFQRLMSRSKSSEWEGFSQHDRGMDEVRQTNQGHKPSTFHYEPPMDNNDCGWNLEQVQSLFPFDFPGNPFSDAAKMNKNTWEPFPSSADDFVAPPEQQVLPRPESPVLSHESMAFSGSAQSLSPILRSDSSPQRSRADSSLSRTSSSNKSVDVPRLRSSTPSKDVGFGTRFTEVAAKLLSEDLDLSDETVERPITPTQAERLAASFAKSKSTQSIDLSLLAPKTRIVGLAQSSRSPKAPSSAIELETSQDRHNAMTYKVSDGFSDAQKTLVERKVRAQASILRPTTPTQGRSGPSPTNSRPTTPTQIRGVPSPNHSRSTTPTKGILRSSAKSTVPSVSPTPRTPTQFTPTGILRPRSPASLSKVSSVVEEPHTPTTVNVTPSNSDISKTPIRGNISRLIKKVAPHVTWKSRTPSERDPPPYSISAHFGSDAVSTTGYSLTESQNSESVISRLSTASESHHTLRGFRSRPTAPLSTQSDDPQSTASYSPKYAALKSRLRELKTHRLQRAAAASNRKSISSDEDELTLTDESFSTYSPEKHGSYSFLAKLEASF